MSTTSIIPTDTIIIFGAIQITGFAEGSYIKVKRNKKEWNQKIGAYGDMTRIRNLDQSGTITITLQRGMSCNQLLSGIKQIDSQTGNGVYPILIKTGDTTIGAGEHAYITGWPEFEGSTEVTNIEWEFFVADLEMNIGAS
ncbi:hypothetical protein PsalN5692_04032 (plasmid) [Piscirickettsia salmonis]|uniref:phage structural protein n=1 Tax=Piscirickettsia salmonis TaxID=1238 RepID=UPI0012B7B14A|nr:hypothetical protein [Piscirickettsia salmonis]QGP52523.1 hypothetical protein PsalN5692_04032 [Piscirickettsia salmonis]